MKEKVNITDERQQVLSDLTYATQTYHTVRDSETSDELDAAMGKVRKMNIDPVEIVRAIIKGTPIELRRKELSDLTEEFHIKLNSYFSLFEEFKLVS